MSKPIIPLLAAFLALWLFGGAYWLSSFQSDSSYQKEHSISNRFEIKDGSFSAKSPTIFAFQTSDADIIINDEQLAVFEQLAEYLDESSKKQLRLVAAYGEDETNNSGFKNLGIARAETIKNLLVKRGGPENRISVEGKMEDPLSLNENGILSGGVEFEIFDKDVSNIITEAHFLKDKIFYFKTNEHEIERLEELENYAAGLKQYTVDNKNAKVLITGFQESKELRSINLKRADFIRNSFLEHGIIHDMILMEVDDSNNKKNDNLNNKKVEIKVL